MKIRDMVARYQLWRSTVNNDGAQLNLPLKLQGEKVLVLLPAEQKDLTIFKQSLPEMTRLFGENNVYFLCSPGSNVRSIFPSKGFHFITPAASSIGWSHLPKKSFLDKLQSHGFTYVFDTNLEENNFAARVLLAFPKAIRFGVNGALGEPFLNLEVKTKYLRDRHLIYRSILEVLSNLTRPEDRVVS